MCLERDALPPDAMLEGTLGGGSRQDVVRRALSQLRQTTDGRRVPSPFNSKSDTAAIEASNTHLFQARCQDPDEPLMLTKRR